MQLLRRAVVMLLVLALAGLVPPSPTVNAAGADPAVKLVMTQDGIAPADGNPHTLTLTVTRDDLPVAGAAVYVGNQALALTDAAGQYQFTVQGTDNEQIPLVVHTPDGPFLQDSAFVLLTGYGVLDIDATDSSGAPLTGYVNVDDGQLNIGEWLSRTGAQMVVPAGKPLKAEVLSEQTADAQAYLLSSTVVPSDRKRTALLMNGADPGLGSLSVSVPLAPANLEFSPAEQQGGRTRYLYLKQAGNVTLHLPPAVWNLQLHSQQPDANYVLSSNQYQVTAGSVTAAAFAMDNLSRIEATVAPGATAPDQIHAQLYMYQPDGPSLGVDLSKPVYTTARTYSGVNVSLYEDIAGRGYYYSEQPAAFPAGGPFTFAPGAVYRFTVGGPVQAELDTDHQAYAGEGVGLRLHLKNADGELNLSAPTQFRITDPDGAVTTLANEWGYAYWNPEKPGTYSITGTYLDPGPHATVAQATATGTVTVNTRHFWVDDAFDGRGISRSYSIPVRMAYWNSDTPVEYAVLTDDWVEVRPQSGRFEVTGSLPATLAEGAAVPVRIRLKGDPDSEIHFTAMLDETPPVLNSILVQPRVSKMQHRITATGSDNLGWQNLRFTVQYTQDLESPNPAWSDRVQASGQEFDLRWQPPLDRPAFRLRVLLKDLAGNQAPPQEYLVTVPTYTVGVEPSDRTLQADVPNEIKVAVQEDGQPASGVQFYVNREYHQTGADGQGTAWVTPQAGQIVPVRVGQLPETDLYTLPLGRSALEFTAVIDNSADAGPQAGLNAADIVYETAVAPGVTRFLGVFRTDGDVPKIGPVRSARDQLVYLAEGHGGAFAHAGGSYSALDLVRDNSDVVNLDEIYGSGDYFYRTDDRPAPHNLYTSADRVRQAVRNQGIEPAPVPAGLPQGPMAGGVTAAEVAVQLPGQTQRVTFQWDSAAHSYRRLVDGVPALLEDGSLVTARNVVVLQAPHRSFYRDDVQEWEIQADLLGRGTATFYRDGKAWEGTWSKPDRDKPIVYTVGGADMQFAAGTAWVLIDGTLPPDGAAPVLQDAAVDGTKLLLTYDDGLDEASVPAGRDFTLVVDGKVQSSPSGVAVRGNKATLTLPTAVRQGAQVSLSYKPGSHAIQDTAGNKAAGFSRQAVKNNSVPPVFSHATIDGNALTLVYSEALDASAVPAATAFGVKVNGKTATVSGVAVDGGRVSVSLAAAVWAGQVVTVAYTPGTRALRDLSGNSAAALPAQAVKNLTAPSLLEPVSAVADGVTLSLRYNASLDPASVPAAADFTVKETGKKLTVSSLSVKDDTVSLTLSQPFHERSAVTVAYARGSKPLRDLAGNLADDLPENPAENQSVAPALKSVAVNGAALSLTFSEPLSAMVVPPGSSFAVRVNGAAVTPKGAQVVGEQVILTLPTAVNAGKVATVGYTPGSRPLQDSAGNRVVAFAGVAVRNETTPSPLQLNQAMADGTAVTLDYNAPLDTASVPAATAFTLKVGGVKATINRVTLAGSQLTLFLAAPVREAAPVTVSYVVGSKPLRDMEGHSADDLVDVSVANHSVPPKLTSATIDGAVLTVTFDEALDGTSLPPVRAFRVGTGGTTATVRSVTISQQTLTLTLAAAVNSGRAVTFGYTPGTRPLKDGQGNLVAAIVNRSVPNVTAPSPLQLSDATIDGVLLRLTYNEDLNPGSIPSSTDFAVKAAGVKISVSAVTLSDRTVTLKLASPAKPGDAVLVSYVVGSKPLKDQAGHAGDDLTDRPVTNLSAAPALQSATVNGNTIVLTYDKDLNTGKLPGTIAFTVKAEGLTVSISRVQVSGNTVVIQLGKSVKAGQAVTLNYRVGTPALQDMAGNLAEPLTNRSLRNETP